MTAIICYRCFARFSPHEVRFKCVYHKVKDQHLGDDAPLIFDAARRRWPRSPRVNAPCPRDSMLSGFRVCPRCHQDLPYHAGRSQQRIVAVVGCGGVGKTLYLWSLLYQLREQLAKDPEPLATAMFEDDSSFETYQSLNRALLHDRELPGSTQKQKQMRDGIVPVIVRILGGRGLGAGMSNLVMYDPSGELLHSLNDIRFLRYLDYAAGIIYLVEPVDPTNLAWRAKASEGLSHIVTHLRQKGENRRQGRLDKTLAVVLTKADDGVFAKTGPDRLLPGGNRDPEFWKDHNGTRREEMTRASDRCRTVLQEMGHHNLLRVAESSFARTAYFAISSLGGAKGESGLTGVPAPIGVEHPLFWSLRAIG